jgi:hypothetical protein
VNRGEAYSGVKALKNATKEHIRLSGEMENHPMEQKAPFNSNQSSA